jgi:hypothetical protein
MRSVLLLSALLCLGMTCSAADASKSPYEGAARSALQVLATNQTNVRFLLSVTNLPKVVRAKLGSIADAGQPYSDGCIGSDPRRRFLLATQAGQSYNIAFEQGGFVPTWCIWKFVLDADGKVIEGLQIEPKGLSQ